jgi:hypothetical protein
MGRFVLSLLAAAAGATFTAAVQALRCPGRFALGCRPMKIRAAVLEEFAKPLVVQDV